MKTAFIILCTFMSIICSACGPADDGTYDPSIAALAPNEALVMKLSACHWGCTKGTVKFANRIAYLGSNNLELTSKEISDLDSYFLLGKSADEGWRCSLPIEISFKQKNDLRTVNQKSMQIYPCAFGDDETITPELLVSHFFETPNEVPYWRLSPEEKSKKHPPLNPGEK